MFCNKYDRRLTAGFDNRAALTTSQSWPGTLSHALQGPPSNFNGSATLFYCAGYLDSSGEFGSPISISAPSVIHTTNHHITVCSVLDELQRKKAFKYRFPTSVSSWGRPAFEMRLFSSRASFSWSLHQTSSIMSTLCGTSAITIAICSNIISSVGESRGLIVRGVAPDAGSSVSVQATSQRPNLVIIVQFLPFSSPEYGLTTPGIGR